MLTKIALGGSGADFDSKMSRGRLVNMIAEANADKSFRSIRRAYGLTQFGTASGAIRSNFLVNGSYAYFISGQELYRCDQSATFYNLGFVGGSGFGQIISNSAPVANQILVLNGSGNAYIYDGSLTQITDVDYFQSESSCVLNERFYFVRRSTNEFFASDISDGFSYSPLSFSTAEESPDMAVAVVAKKSSLWVVGERTTEFWQSFDDTNFPLRKVRGATIERGIKARASLAEVEDSFAFLADDLTVIMVKGSSYAVISDLDFHLKVRGNGTLTSPGFSTVADAVGFFIDGPSHKIYCLTFPSEGYTWCFDLSTGMSHERSSESTGYWRAAFSANFAGKIIMGDMLSGKIWYLDPSSSNEGGDILRSKIITPSVKAEANAIISWVEIDMEVGQPESPSSTPQMMVRSSVDGGYNWRTHQDVSLGGIGFYGKRPVIRRLGRVVKNKDFMLELMVTDECRLNFYGAEANIEVSI